MNLKAINKQGRSGWRKCEFYPQDLATKEFAYFSIIIEDRGHFVLTDISRRCLI